MCIIIATCIFVPLESGFNLNYLETIGREIQKAPANFSQLHIEQVKPGFTNYRRDI